MHNIDILTLGELLIDMFPDRIGPRMGEVQSFIPKPGGAPANVAVAASRLGLDSAFIGKVGDDLFGSYLQGVLEQEGVNTEGMRFDPEARTTMAMIAMPDENTAEFVFYRNPGADQRLSTAELDEKMIRSAKALHIGSLSLTDEPARSATYQAVRIARQAGGMVSYDVNYRPSLWRNPDQALVQAQTMMEEVDLVKVNEVEAALLTGKRSLDPSDPVQIEDAAIALSRMGPGLAVITLGSEGSFFQVESGGGYVPPFKVETVDAVGCGDAFVAGLLAKLVSEDEWRNRFTLDRMLEIMRFANAVGALTSLKRGAIPAMPTRKEVEQFLSERN
jgi:fructokinase